MITDDMARNFRKTAFLSTMILLLGVVAAQGQTNSGLLVELFPKEQVFSGRASAVFLEGGHIAESDADEDFQMAIYDTEGRFRLKPGAEESVRIGYDFTYLDLQTGFDGLPERLVDHSVAVGFPIGKHGDWIFGGTAGIGYAGDSFYGDGDAYYGLASLVAFWKQSETSAFVFALDYDGNRTFLPDIPLPGFAYIKRISDRLELTAGLPITAIKWKATDQLTVELAYSIPDDVRLDVGYEVFDHLTLFGRVRQQREAFYFDGLAENYDRILFEQRRAEAGVRYEPCENAAVDLALGYAWSGEFSEGFDSRRNNEIADISDEPYIRGGIELKY
jgi:hypothetical protein